MNTIDTIIKYGNEVLKLQKTLQDSKNSNLKCDEEQIYSDINFYTSFINEHSNNHSKHILRCIEQINSIKEKLALSNKPNIRQILEQDLNLYMSQIEKSISAKSNSKEAQFRNKQIVNIDPVTQAYQIGKMCAEHQKELKQQENAEKSI